MPEKPLIVGNWKCNPASLKEAQQLFNSVDRKTKDIRQAEIVVCPPFVYLPKIQTKKYKVRLGAQNVFWEEKGAFTGEISPLMLKDLGCEYIIVGHSERRNYFRETDGMINKKIKAVLAVKLTPIFCVGETKEEKEKGLTKKIIGVQIGKGLKDIEKIKVKKIKIAYEPVWAIGTGKACLPLEAAKVGKFIRETISKIYNKKITKNLKILYGGSVKAENAALYLLGADFQGLLVGGASLKSEEFLRIAKSTE